MSYNFSQFKTKIAAVESWLAKEFSGVRTGRATPAILDSITVESYGSRQPLKAVAGINIEDAKTLRVDPWDKSQAKAVETALVAANLGLSVAADSSGIRVVFPDLTAERRQALIKVVKSKLEEARVSLRQEREKVWNDIVEQEKVGRLAEDEKFRGKDELQKLVDDGNHRLDILAKRKEEELLA